MRPVQLLVLCRVQIAQKSPLAGFLVTNGRDVTLGNNTAVNKRQIGFVLQDIEDSRLVESSANENDVGIVVHGSRDEIILNTADRNLVYGIAVDSGAQNRISANTALRNRRYDLWQRLEENCGNNIWVNNTFRKANLTCIQ